MKLENIFETDEFIIWKDNKGWDFAYDIENKTDEEITIQYGFWEEEITIKDWVGLFADEESIIEMILRGDYKVV